MCLKPTLIGRRDSAAPAVLATCSGPCSGPCTQPTPRHNLKNARAVQVADGAAPAADAAVGTKRKAEPEDDPRAAAGEAAKRHRASAEALLQAAAAPPAPAASSGEHRESFHLACRFFDEAGVGYLDEKDLEDIIHCVHPLTSRRWVRTLVESVCRRGRLRYADLPDLQVVYHPPQPPPVGLAAGAVSAPSGGAKVQVDGVMVDVAALRSASAAASKKLQDESGARARAEVRPGGVWCVCWSLCLSKCM